MRKKSFFLWESWRKTKQNNSTCNSRVWIHKALSVHISPHSMKCPTCPHTQYSYTSEQWHKVSVMPLPTLDPLYPVLLLWELTGLELSTDHPRRRHGAPQLLSYSIHPARAQKSHSTAKWNCDFSTSVNQPYLPPPCKRKTPRCDRLRLNMLGMTYF